MKGALKSSRTSKAGSAAAAPGGAQRPPDRPAAAPPAVSPNEQAARPSRLAPPTPAELQQERLRKEAEKKLPVAKALQERAEQAPKSIGPKKEKPIVGSTDLAAMRANLAKMDYPEDEEAKSAAAKPDQPKAGDARWDNVLAEQKQAAEDAAAMKLQRKAEAKEEAEKIEKQRQEFAAASAERDDKAPLIEKFRNGGLSELYQILQEPLNFSDLDFDASAFAAGVTKNRSLIVDTYVLSNQPDRDLIVDLERMAHDLAKRLAAAPLAGNRPPGMSQAYHTNPNINDLMSRCEQAWRAVWHAYTAIKRLVR